MNEFQYVALAIKDKKYQKYYLVRIDYLCDKYLELNNPLDKDSMSIQTIRKEVDENIIFIPLKMMDKITNRLKIENILSILEYQYGITIEDNKAILKEAENEKREYSVIFSDFDSILNALIQDKDKANDLLSFIGQQKQINQEIVLSLKEAIKAKDLEQLKIILNDMEYSWARDIKSFVLSRDIQLKIDTLEELEAKTKQNNIVSFEEYKDSKGLIKKASGL